MAVTDIRPFKRAKRGRTSDLCDFLSFPYVSGGDYFAGEPFWLAIESFLKRYGRLRFPLSRFPSLVTWQILFQVGDQADGADTMSLDVVEEDVARSRSVYCDQCRVVGWSGHPVCRKRYHFIIRENSNPVGFDRACMKCGCVTSLFDSRCKSCNSALSADDLEDWVYNQFEDTTHLLHGVVHSNGYGHLLRINGREGGARIFSGSDIMNFWDRLCKRLAVRKVSVMDLSKKHGTEYRLLHGVAKGQVWYGSWGYQFETGSYALTSDAYQNAIHTISSIPLSTFFFQDRGPRIRLQTLITFYQSLSETELRTLKDLFSCLLNLIGERNTAKPKSLSCPWTRNDVDRVCQCMVKVLITSTIAEKDKWVSWRTLKGAVCKAASPELIDYCLKHLGGKVAADGLIVRARCDPNSNAVEYRMELQSCTINIRNGVDTWDAHLPSKEQVINDLRYLYNSILHPDTMVMYRPKATRKLVVDSATKLLDCKQFIKDYMVEQVAVRNPFTIHLWCHLELEDYSRDNLFPPELIVLPGNSTIADLKREATKAFKAVYVILKRFYIQELPDLGRIEDRMTLNLLFGVRGSVRIRGRCNAKYGLDRFRVERGPETWTVDCICGSKDDDGERMLACDKCSIWQHTRCVGIKRTDEVPAKFICERCLGSCAESECYSGGRSPREEDVECERDGECEVEFERLNQEAESIVLKQDTNPVLPSRKTCGHEIRPKDLGLGSSMCMTFEVQ